MYEGLTTAQRQARRQEIRAGRLAAAEVDIYRCGRSVRCATGDHARTDHLQGRPVRVGCQNDGSTCLCQCHDPKDGTDAD